MFFLAYPFFFQKNLSLNEREVLSLLKDKVQKVTASEQKGVTLDRLQIIFDYLILHLEVVAAFPSFLVAFPFYR
jgi:hypothetical protein